MIVKDDVPRDWYYLVHCRVVYLPALESLLKAKEDAFAGVRIQHSTLLLLNVNVCSASKCSIHCEVRLLSFPDFIGCCLREGWWWMVWHWGCVWGRGQLVPKTPLGAWLGLAWQLHLQWGFNWGVRRPHFAGVLPWLCAGERSPYPCTTCWNQHQCIHCPCHLEVFWPFLQALAQLQPHTVVNSISKPPIYAHINSIFIVLKPHTYTEKYS